VKEILRSFIPPLMASTIRVAIIEDHKEFREGLTFIFKTTTGFSCVGAFGSVEAALTNFPECDVLLLDINLPGKSGTESVSLFRKKNSDMKIVMLTVFDDDENIFNAIAAGADGYILKKTPPARLMLIIQDVIEGGSVMSPYVAKRMIDVFRNTVPAARGSFDLSSRELEILSSLVQGLGNKQIAHALFISPDTVRNHLRNIYEKLHVHTRTQAVTLAMKNRLV
jgi:DNA-binding NarL/FixJ family response regulator